MTGNACRLAAENLLAAMKKDDGTYRTYDEMIAEGIETKVLGQWVATACADRPIDQATAQGDPFSVYMYTLFLPEVCVDTETGKVTVEKFTCVADVGTIMNKLLVDGSFYGGLAQGIGLALSENFEDLEKHTTLLKCGIPYPKDVPDDIELHYVQPHVQMAHTAQLAAAKRHWMHHILQSSTLFTTRLAHVSCRCQQRLML